MLRTLTRRLLVLVFLFPSLAYATWTYNPLTNKQDFYWGSSDIDRYYANNTFTALNLTTLGLGERISGNTYGNYFDFNDEGNGVIAVSPTIALKNATAPVNPTDTGTVGQVAFDGTYWYVCTATNTWMRTQLSTWVISRDLLMLEGIQLQLEGVDLQL
jgi:hypothetical protein